jgi:hypothetical protein
VTLNATPDDRELVLAPLDEKADQLADTVAGCEDCLATS